MYRYKYKYLLIMFLGITTSLTGVCLPLEVVANDYWVHKVENSLYDKNYVNREVYRQLNWFDTNSRMQLVPNSKSTTVCFLNGYYTRIDGNVYPTLQFVKLDKAKIFRLHDFIRTRNTQCPGDAHYINFFENILAGHYTLHEALISSWDENWDSLGTMVQVLKTPQYQWASLGYPGEHGGLTIDTFHYHSSDKSMAQLIMDLKPQLEKYNFNLSETKVIAVDALWCLADDWGFIFYDSEKEYYMSPFPYLYDNKKTRESQYGEPNDFTTFKIEPFRLYDLKKDLIPFMLSQEKTFQKWYRSMYESVVT